MNATPPISTPGCAAHQRGLTRAACAAATIVIGAAFLFAVLGKAWSPVRFEMVVLHVLRGIGVESSATRPVVLALLILEAWIGLVYLLGIAGRATHRLTACLLAGFLVVLWSMWFSPPVRGCGCLGLWSMPDDPRRELLLGMIRNTGLLACIAGLWLARPAPTGSVVVRPRTHGTHGFSLLELLFVVLLIAVVLALALPAFSKVRQSSRDVVDSVGSKQVYLATAAYSTDAKDRFPYCATPGDLAGPLTIHGTPVPWSAAYFHGQARLSMNLLRPSYLPVTSSFVHPAGPEKTGLPPDIEVAAIWTTYTAFAHPRYWAVNDDAPDAAWLAAARWMDIAYPSQKGLFLDMRASSRLGEAYLNHAAAMPWGVVWADGAATRRRVNLDLRYRTVHRPTANFEWPVLSTEGGLAGIDDFAARP